MVWGANKMADGCGMGLGAVKINQIGDLGIGLGEAVLDIGCGMGYVIGHLKARERHGTDNLGQLIDYAKRMYPGVDFLNTDALALEYTDCSFDTILLLDILEHVEDDKALLQRTHKMLKAGGRIIVSTPISGANLLPFSPGLTERMHRLWGHQRVYSEKKLKNVLEASGFKVSKKRCYAYLLVRILLFTYLSPFNRLITRFHPMHQAHIQFMDKLIRFFERFIAFADRLEKKIPLGCPFQMMVVAEKA
jgi:SAM-dependent methyltransferase